MDSIDEKYKKMQSCSAHDKARQYHNCVKFLLDEPADAPAQLSAKVVNCAFAIELFLKSILISYGISGVHGHNLTTLFDKLPNEIQTDIIQQTVYKREEFKLILGVEEKAYTEWRYPYEELGEHTIHLDFLLQLLEASHRVSSEVQRDRGLSTLK